MWHTGGLVCLLAAEPMPTTGSCMRFTATWSYIRALLSRTRTPLKQWMSMPRRTPMPGLAATVWAKLCSAKR